MSPTSRRDERRRRPARVKLRGRFLITESALAETARLLTTYRDVDSDHEGLVFLAGLELDGGTTLLASAIAPDCDHGRGHVMADAAAVRDVARAAHEVGLGVLAQVHSHPGPWTGHSDGDDVMVLMPFEGMLSIVVPHYGQVGTRPLRAMGVHQYQDGSWRLITEDSIEESFRSVPASVDLR